MKRFLIYLSEILILFVIQTSTFHYFGLADIMPNLLLILVVSSAYMRGRLTGLGIGFFTGLLMDIVYGELIGLYAFIYMIIGYFTGYANKIYNQSVSFNRLLFAIT